VRHRAFAPQSGRGSVSHLVTVTMVEVSLSATIEPQGGRTSGASPAHAVTVPLFSSEPGFLRAGPVRQLEYQSALPAALGGRPVDTAWLRAELGLGLVPGSTGLCSRARP
jgi:hypothetical protein